MTPAALRRYAPWALWGACALALALQALVLLLRAVTALHSDTEIGYGDAYVVYDVLHYISTGTIYRSAGDPPYTLSLYGPLLYYTLSLPVRLGQQVSVFFGPRVVVLLAFALCCVLSWSITRRLTRSRAIGALALVLPLAVGYFPGWVGQVRSDFLGAALALAGIRLLLSGRKGLVAAGGAAAGAAFLFKLTFVSVPAAALLWYLLRRRVHQALVFGAAAAAVAIGGHAFAGLLQPEMLRHLTAMTRPITDDAGAYDLLRALVREPVVLLGIAGAGAILRKGVRSRWGLLGLCAGVSLGVAALSSRQAGANINYFIEGTLLLIPFAAVATSQLIAESRRVPLLRVLFVAVLLFAVIEPEIAAARTAVRRLEREWGGQQNDRIARLERVLHTRRVFSEIGRYALMTAGRPVLTDAYGAHYLEIHGKYDPEPLAALLRQAMFDVVITRRNVTSYRGIEHLSPVLRQHVAEAYQPFCTYLDALIHVKRSGRDTALTQDLARIGCEPYAMDRRGGGQD